jgi:outer membrane protein OmpA-like peptidoglycan-associated protein
MMRSFVAATLTVGLLVLVACETPQLDADGAAARAVIPATDATPAPAPSAAVEPQLPAAPEVAAEATPARDAAATLDDARVVQTDRGLMMTLEDGTFDSDLAVIKPGARRGLDLLAKFLHENPGRRVQIEAFTDAEGSSVYNLELSQDRADAVALAVIDRGVEAARVRAIGWGERYPVTDNDSEQGRERNRRVEITVSTGDAAVPVRVVNTP